MNNLLLQPKNDGYPFDYLLARLPNRRRQAGERFQTAEAGPDRRRRLQQGYRWVFVRLSPRLRRRFTPCFLLPEIRTLQRLVRAAVAGERQALERACQGSLLNRELLRECAACRSIGDLLSVYGCWFGRFARADSEWTAVYRRDGSRGVEEGLADGIMQALGRERQQADVARFLADLVDRRNLLTVARYLRWELDDPPLIEGGGPVSSKLLTEKNHGRSALREAVARFAGGEMEDVALLDRRLLKQIGRRLEKAARDLPGTALVIDYLWRLEMAFRAQGVQTWTSEDVGEWENLA